MSAVMYQIFSIIIITTASVDDKIISSSVICFYHLALEDFPDYFSYMKSTLKFEKLQENIQNFGVYGVIHELDFSSMVCKNNQYSLFSCGLFEFGTLRGAEHKITYRS